MSAKRTFRYSALAATLAAMLAVTACTSSEQTVHPVEAGSQPTKSSRAVESDSKVLSDFSQYQSAFDAAKRGDDAYPQQFLAQAGDSAMAENVRNEWLKSLGARGAWDMFRREYAKLAPAGRSQEVQCFAELNSGEYGKLAGELVKETKRLPAGCTRLVEAAAQSGKLSKSDGWRRVRGLIGNGQTTDARNLAAALGGGQTEQEFRLVNIIGSSAQKSASSAAALQSMSGSLSREQAGYAWGVLGLVQARAHNMSTALNHFNRADRSQLDNEQFEWYARAALRLQRWSDLASVIRSMPAKLQNDPAWQYWLGRSLAAQGNSGSARGHYEKAAASGRNFYALMAAEELGNRVSTRNNAEPDKGDVKRLAKDGAYARALTLFKNAQSSGNGKMRSMAQAEWRFATRGADEDTLLAAAQLAYDNKFYDMAINSAERTDKKLNYNLRYLSPFKETTMRYASQVGVDPAWVYGLIRQESRFAIGAQSVVGAQGLMQVMPATAREIAGKTGMSSSELYTMDGNIRMGTWYMADVKRRLRNNEVMTTAGYNAGPSRARNWQASTPLEGAIYAETIPFTETRDYVKKVMANATYYASLFNTSPTSLKQRMGTVPAR
ncbi:transglycosylase SLT domain-containing protein [Neisseria sp.]|uniref:lytic transglycosylase domain-containing protein n=1 Tax=Neisseria sp. TaxID=192066 RepID=UPI0035A093B7